MRGRFPLTYELACKALYAVEVLGMTQTEAAIVLRLNVGTVCHVVHGRRFPGAHPRPF